VGGARRRSGAGLGGGAKFRLRLTASWSLPKQAQF
jgi:hypothetical protein